MKITVYTIKDCAFSKQEKEYLNTNKLVFEEKDLEANKDFLTEMLAISNNFAGTPVTRVEKDDGTIAVLKGFTKAEFDTTFGLASPKSTTEAGTTPAPTTTGSENLTPAVPTDLTDLATPAVEQPITDLTGSTDSTDSTGSAGSVSPAPISAETPISEPTNPEPTNPDLTNQVTNNQATAPSDPLKSVMDDLQAKAEPVTPVIEQSPTVTPPVFKPTNQVTNNQATSPPVVPLADAPTIPDFPAK